MFVTAEQAERFPRRLEQQAVHFFGMPRTYCVQFFRQSENHVEVRNRQQFRNPRLYPFLTFGALTFGTGTLSAGIVTHTKRAALRTNIYMTAQFRCTAFLHRRQRTKLECIQPDGRYPLSQSAQDAGYFDFFAHCTKRVSSGLNARWGLLRATCKYFNVVRRLE